MVITVHKCTECEMVKSMISACGYFTSVSKFVPSKLILLVA